MNRTLRVTDRGEGIDIKIGILIHKPKGDVGVAVADLKSDEEVGFVTMALAGVGLNTDLSSLCKIGLKPLIVGTFVATVLAVISLSLILLTPLGS